ncbi:hypothetical protein Agabi119p4_5558 [Agaricus bisporus var. burnettii]|uniref:SH3 domain-containing protein n=1 Tax=Agaricus bisporus var. burnettii TaxID=192524 RepID=A0A8H7F201_AGABI|nr:hypothetical protein Agabi119p4_5558 [Agaricus bisporus var. burnettii]
MTVDSLLAHIVSQTRGNLEILVAQNQLADSECRSLLEKLKSIEDVSKIAERTQNTAIAQTATTPAHTTPDSRTSNPLPTPEPTSVLFRARAIWPYNEHGRESRDLPFSPGDIIEVFHETNGDWWEGRCNGRSGLFPSSYVEKTNSFGFPARPMNDPPPLTGEKFTPHITPPNYQTQYMAPNPGPGYAPVPIAPPNVPGPVVTPQVAEQQQHNQPPKKHRFPGGLSSTFAHSAVGGVGFGAGSALINNIF